MMSPRQDRKTQKTQVTTKTALSPLEEKVVRMRHGLRAPTAMILEQVGQGNSEIAAQLRTIEENALRHVGSRRSDTKRKIVNVLRRK